MTNEDYKQVALANAKTQAEKDKIVQKYDMCARLKEQRALTRSDYIMPDYALLCTPIMQETKTWCAAATIQQTLRYLGVSYSSQAAIMSSVGAGPGLDTVLNYINARMPADKYNYIRYSPADKNEFEGCLAFDVTVYQPMVFTLANRSGEGTWPYPTGGHFTNCDGKLYGEYLFSDPYYFLRYVSSATDNNGYHYQPFGKLWDANAQLFGTGHNTVGF